MIIFDKMPIHCPSVASVHFFTVEFSEIFIYSRRYPFLDKLQIFSSNLFPLSVYKWECLQLCAYDFFFHPFNRVCWRTKAFNLKRFNLLIFPFNGACF